MLVFSFRPFDLNLFHVFIWLKEYLLGVGVWFVVKQMYFQWVVSAFQFLHSNYSKKRNINKQKP